MPVEPIWTHLPHTHCQGCQKERAGGISMETSPRTPVGMAHSARQMRWGHGWVRSGIQERDKWMGPGSGPGAWGSDSTGPRPGVDL